MNKYCVRYIKEKEEDCDHNDLQNYHNLQKQIKCIVKELLRNCKGKMKMYNSPNEDIHASAVNNQETLFSSGSMVMRNLQTSKGITITNFGYTEFTVHTTGRYSTSHTMNVDIAANLTITFSLLVNSIPISNYKVVTKSDNRYTYHTNILLDLLEDDFVTLFIQITGTPPLVVTSPSGNTSFSLTMVKVD